METNQDRILRIPEVVAMTGLSASTLSRYAKQEGMFAARLRVGKYACGYRLSSVLDYINSRPEIKGKDKTTPQAA